MAGSRKEYELLFKLKAALGGNFTGSFKAANNAMKGLQNNLTKINAAQKKIQGYQKQEKALESNRKKLERLNKEHEKLQKELQKTGQPTEELLKELERNEAQIAKTTEKISSQEKALDKLSGELKEAGIDTSNLTKENERLQKSYDAIKKNQENIAKLSAAQEKNAAAISKTKGALVTTVAATAAAGAALYNGAVKPASEFEAMMKTVQSTAGATDEEFKILQDAAKAASNAVGQYNYTEAAEGLQYMALAGWNAQQSAKSLTPVLRFAAATEQELGTCSDLVTDSMSALGLQVDELSDYLDWCIKANNKANTTAAQLQEAFIGCGGAMRKVGQEYKEGSIALEILADNGVKGAEAGTAYNSILTRITSKEAALNQIKKMGVAVFDKQTGKFRGLQTVLSDLNKAMASYTDEQKSAALATIAGTNYGSQFQYLLDATAESVNGETNAWNAGNLKDKA